MSVGIKINTKIGAQGRIRTSIFRGRGENFTFKIPERKLAPEEGFEPPQCLLVFQRGFILK